MTVKTRPKLLAGVLIVLVGTGVGCYLYVLGTGPTSPFDKWHTIKTEHLSYTITDIGGHAMPDEEQTFKVVNGAGRGADIHGCGFTFEENLSTYKGGEDFLTLKFEQHENTIKILTIWDSSMVVSGVTNYHITGRVWDRTPGEYTIHFIWYNKADKDPHEVPLATREVTLTR